MEHLCLTYVSKSNIESNFHDKELQRIVKTSEARNADLDITGALIGTEDFFAQILEGHASDVRALADRIAADPRHSEFTVIDLATRPDRWFKTWSLAFAGRSHFTSRRIAPLISTPSESMDVLAILQIFRAFSQRV